jgi:hypothetical protein
VGERQVQLGTEDHDRWRIRAQLLVKLHTLGETFVAAGAEYDARGDFPWRLQSLVNRGLLLQGSHEPCAHDRAGAVDPDQAQRPGAALRLTHHIRGQVGMEYPPRRALLRLWPPFVGPENGQKLLVSAWSGAVNILDLISMVPVATSSHPSAAIGANTFGSLPGYSMLSVVWLASALPSLRATKGVPLTLKLGKRRVKHLGLLGFRVNPMLVMADLYRNETYPANRLQIAGKPHQPGGVNRPPSVGGPGRPNPHTDREHADRRLHYKLRLPREYSLLYVSMPDIWRG